MGQTKGHMMSSQTTAGNSRIGNSTGTVWNNYSGSKHSHNIQANQINFKNSSGDHYFYNTQTGVQGMAGGNRNK